METRFSIASKKRVSPVYFTSRPEHRDGVSNSAWNARFSNPYRPCRPNPPKPVFFLGHLSHQCFGGEHQSGDRSGVLQCCASHLGRIDDAGLYQVLVFAGSHVEPFIAPVILDFLDDQSAFLPSVVGELACRKLQCTANDFRTNSLITVQLNLIERLLCAEVSNASAGNDTLLDGRTGRMQGIFHASLLLLHLRLRRGADIDNGNTAGELGQTFLQFFTIVVRSGFIDLTTNLLNSALDIFGGTFAFNDRRVFLVDRDPLCPAEIFQRDVFKLDPKVLGKATTTGEHRDILEHRFAAVAEAGSFHCGNLEGAP